jgi:hypothetical protein
MINERLIAEKFNVIWKQNFPLLTPTFIKIVNETQIQNANLKPIPLVDEIRFDLVSEAAFIISEICNSDKITPVDYLNIPGNNDKLFRMTGQNVWAMDEYEGNLLSFSEVEQDNIQKLAHNICEFISKAKLSFVQFRPRLRGYGVIPELEADLVVDDTLYEIKTVTRNFKSSDIRQLFIYLALNQVSGERNWKHAGLYNPRRGKFFRFNVNRLVYNLAGGNSPIEAFESLLNGIVRDIQFDSKF